MTREERLDRWDAAMNSNHDPETMTAYERRVEIAGLLARALLRAVRNARSRTSSASEKVSESDETSGTCIELLVD